jgi:hypothetical protein
VDKKQDEFKVKVDTKYGKYVKLGIAMLTTFGLIGTGAHQAGFKLVLFLIHFTSPFLVVQFL